jgi:hypothetical protein
MRIVVVSGALANKVGNGGGTWERMSWFEVYFVEEISANECVDAEGKRTSFADSVNLAWFRSVTEWFGVAERSALVYAGGKECAGVPWTRLLATAESAELLVNLSGHLTLEPLLARIRRKAYIDVDPGFTQFWHADPNTPFRIAQHDDYFTIGENIGSPDCPIPALGWPSPCPLPEPEESIRWRPIRQPVVLWDWPVVGVRTQRPPWRSKDGYRLRFTTIASWRGPFGPVQAGGKTYGLKVHEFRKYLPLARLAFGIGFEIALDIHPGDAKDLAALRENGWRIVEPRPVAGDAASFRRYVQESGAEFSVAQGIYVDTNSGWFSDRTVRYLASGKPTLVQETGFSRHIRADRGLVSFRTLAEAVAGAEAIAADYEMHCRAAREIAQEYFDSDKVLGRLLEEVGVAP